ncbi:MAG TPA: sugar phosphate isomerase/epimerase [Candidatus Stackebrandtia excrementipullorum]|nr:sugar phosphate isomerase/epimerase [Candidatus Stackebrandtia excrementipullorum]
MTQVGFSTLGFPGRPVTDVLKVATRHGADLVQLRIADDEPVNPDMSARARHTVKRQFLDAGIGFGALATYVKLSDPGLGEPLRAHLDLAADLGSPALRLFPGDAEPGLAAERLGRAVEIAAEMPVRLTVETHDAFLTGTQIAELLSAVDGRAGAVWDLLHPWRAGESVPITANALWPHLAEFQIKDVPSIGDLRPLIPGTGVLPIANTLAMIRDRGFDGPIVFEHEAKWRFDADPFEEALAAAMRLAKP